MIVLNFKIKLDKTYVSRDKKVFTIFREITSTEPGYEKGYRFKGKTTADESADYSQIHVVSFKENGQHIVDGVSSPLDLVSEHLGRPLTLKDVDNCAEVAEMVGHEVNFGILQGWKAGPAVEITSSDFNALMAYFISPNETHVITNKMARCIGFVVNKQNEPRVVTVVYPYDGKYYMNTLYSPELS